MFRYCSWNTATNACYTRDSAHSTSVGWITSVQNSHRCSSYTRSISKTIYPGDGILLLSCLDEDNAESITSEWQVDRVPIKDSPHIQHTVNGGLVLLNVSAIHSGNYQCLSEGIPLIEYIVTVDDSEFRRSLAR